MTTEQVSTIFALLSFLALAIAVGIAFAAATGRLHRLEALRPGLVPLAFLVAVVCTAGSLYYSGIVHFRPCRLCWWQRISMYPLVPVLGIGFILRDRAVAFYGLALSLIGLGWAIYHTQLRWFPEQGSSCEAEAACTSVWVNTFGFVSIPFMAAAGFAAITALLGASARLTQVSASPAPEHRSSHPQPELTP